jgi:hypothetical protein
MYSKIQVFFILEWVLVLAPRCQIPNIIEFWPTRFVPEDLLIENNILIKFVVVQVDPNFFCVIYI